MNSTSKIKLKRNLNIVLILVVLTGMGIMAPHAKADAPPEVYLLTITGTINPGTALLVQTAIEDVTAAQARALIMTLDTPGGLMDSMRDIVMAILNSPVPVVVYVYPSGARAASAGVLITLAADIAVMAPGTNIGAAHPVGTGGQEIEGAMSSKIVNDMAAQGRTIAEKRGRNAEWVERAIRDSESITESEALEAGVIDLVVRNLDELLDAINGWELEDREPLDVTDVVIIDIEEGIRSKILRTISDPNVAYILMMIGLLGLYFELSNPGAIFPGVIGGLSLILAFYAFQTLPINTAGLLLILAGLILFILELKIASYGLLSIAGIAALLLGSLMLFDARDPELQLAWKVLIPTITIVSAFFVAIATLVVKAHRHQPLSGQEAMYGEIGVVKQPLIPHGKVFIHGELWRAKASEPLPEGTTVRVVAMRNLLLEVEAWDEG